MAYMKNCPICGKEDCFGYENGHCVVLVENNFTKDCPFFKTQEQVAQEQEYCRQRMAEKK
jgi:hypothetical protein